jgi:hypothetical protein
MKAKTSSRTDPAGIEMTTIKVIKLKPQDRITLTRMAASYGVADPIDFCHGIIMAADQEDPNPVLFRTYE